jgi:uncharacterized YceG family protein
VNGGYSGRGTGGRGAADAGRGYRGQGYGQQGSGQQDHGDQDSGEPGHGDRGRPRRGAGAQPPGNDPGGRPGQPQGGGPGSGQRPGQPQGRDRGYGQPQGPDEPYGQPQGRDRGYRQGQGPDQPYGQPHGGDQGYYPPQGPDQGYGQPQGRDRGYGQPQGARPDAWGQEQRQPAAPRYPQGPQQPGQRGIGAQSAWPGDAQQAYGPDPRAAQRGADPGWQAPGGYDPRGTAPRRASEGYPGDGYPGDGYYHGPDDAQLRQGDYQGRGGDPRDDAAFLPGFGSGDDYAGGPGGQYPGEAGGYAGKYEDADERPGRRGRRGRADRRGGGGGNWDDDGGARRQRSTVRRLAPWIALLVILTPIVIGGLYVYHLYENKYHPADYSGPGTGSVAVQVKSGDTAFSLGPRLQALGVVASARAFELAAEHSTSTTGLEAGFYKVHLHMQASLAWAALLNPKDRVQLTVTIPEGKRASQVIAIIAKETSIPLSDFQAVIKNPAHLGLPSYAKGDVEGYLFPATYTIQPNETALQILQAMVQRFDVEAQQINISAAATRVGLTPEQLITEASMVQAEGGSVSDYAKIARVIINRRNAGMKLQFDSVLLYGLNAYGINVTEQQINTPGPYNDFQHAGLPPGPICNPGDAAIQGVLHPASGDWLYFLSRTGGASEFSATPLSGQ